jgi:hypothetical protein
MIHGSWERFARTAAAPHTGEAEWILRYVRRRHEWLTGVERLRPTAYRTRFFLGQIAISNWQLRLPLTVNGVRLTAETFASHPVPAGSTSDVKAAAASPGTGQVFKAALGSAGEQFDRVETVVNTAQRRADAVKSLWTTVGGTIWQAAWGVFGFAAGLPTEIWIVVAVIAAALMLFYLHRQLTLGKIRETAAHQ